ncbi:hypothetical protein NOGI109294_04680 [Nocardiopsis gilva]
MIHNPVRPLRSASYGVFALGTVLALGACSGPNLDELRAGPVPEDSPELDKSGLPPEPTKDAPVSERVEWSLIETTSVYARWYGDGVEADCPEVSGSGGFGSSEDITCTVTVDGISAKWDVSIGSIMSEMEPVDGRHVVRSAVEDVARYKTKSEHVRCEMDEVQLVSPDDEPITCVWANEDDHGRLVMRLDNMQFSDKSFWLTSAD